MGEDNNQGEPIEFAPEDGEKWRPQFSTVKHDVDGTIVTKWSDR